MNEALMQRLKKLLQEELDDGDREELAAAIADVKPDCQDFKLSIKDPFQRRLFQELANRHGLSVFREPRQHRSTLMVHGPTDTMQDKVWPLYQNLSRKLHDELVAALGAFLERELSEVIDEEEAPKSAPEPVDPETELAARSSEMISVSVEVDRRSGDVIPLDPKAAVPVRVGKSFAVMALPPISELYRGDRKVESISIEDSNYRPFFVAIERTAHDYCHAQGRSEKDEEFLRLYKRLKRKPDASDHNPLFAYLQAAARAYMARHEVSRSEYRALIGRLVASVRSFRSCKRSTNYSQQVLAKLCTENY